MAKEAPKKDDSAAPPAKRGKKMLFIVLGAVVVSVVIGLVVGKLMFSHKAAAEGEEGQAEHKEASHKPEPGKPPVFVNLDPFTVNLQSDTGAEQYLQAVATLRVTDDKTGEELKLYMPQIRHEILSIMAAKTAADVGSLDGRKQLAEEMREVTNEVLGYKPSKRKKGGDDDNMPVIAVFFTQFIVQ
ncbi:MAG: flagellar basal body-associated FliL family protein [Rhodocyclaceae bacterium]